MGQHFHGQARTALMGRLSQRLPLSLEQLHLEMNSLFRVYEDDNDEKLSADFFDLMNSVESLAIGKEQHLPNLTRVVLGEPLESYHFDLACAVEESARGIIVIRLCAEAAIELHCWKSESLPRPFDS